MGVDASQFLSQQVRAQQLSQHMRRNGGAGTVDIPGMRPGEPGYKERVATANRDAAIADGEPVPIEQLPPVVMDAPAPAANPPAVIPLGPAPEAVKRRRLTITFGPTPGVVMASLEESPDWEMVTKRPFKYNLADLRGFVPLLEELVPIKDMTGELYEEEAPAPVEQPTPIRRGRPRKSADA